MGKKLRKSQKEVAKGFKETHGISFLDALEKVSIECLLELGKRIASTDFAVRFFNNKRHPQFYRNKEALLKAVRRSYGVGAFEHREQAHQIMEKYEHYFTCRQEEEYED
ncbi:hypothetical protein COA01_23165 [Bacillus cereus]|uniref:hypothetical protein n=1 Tax=Bacillus cereus TaxID=1396 RepID=UPI000BFDB5B4|nr:hypothetical protein [Bacillus cereus]PGP18645.1 hypothetical protein COA01_23165 [Bacillus cereus]